MCIRDRCYNDVEEGLAVLEQNFIWNPESWSDICTTPLAKYLTLPGGSIPDVRCPKKADQFIGLMLKLS